MSDLIKAIGFPVSIVAVIISWGRIANNQDTHFDKIILFVATVVMLFMWLYNRNEYMAAQEGK